MTWKACEIDGCDVKTQTTKGRHLHITLVHPGYYGTLRVEEIRHRSAKLSAELPQGYVEIYISSPDEALTSGIAECIASVRIVARMEEEGT